MREHGDRDDEGTSVMTNLLHIELKGPTGLTLGAGTRPRLLVLSLVEWTENEPTAEAVVLDHAELREDVGRSCHNSTGAYELVQMKLSVYSVCVCVCVCV